jgi:hypothetical protein
MASTDLPPNIPSSYPTRRNGFHAFLAQMAHSPWARRRGSSGPASLRNLPEDHELVQLEYLEIKTQSLFEKRTVAEHFPALRELTAWNTFKLQFVAIGSLFRTKAIFKRVIVATVTM